MFLPAAGNVRAVDRGTTLSMPSQPKLQPKLQLQLPRHRGATYPPGTPFGDNTNCHSCACRHRKLAIEPAR